LVLVEKDFALNKNKDIVSKEEKVNYLIEPIYFKKDKYNITLKASKRLNYVASLLRKNKNLVIEIRSYCDVRNTALYNMRLSQNRAKFTALYIEQKGVSKERLIQKYYGESNPVNDCNGVIGCLEKDHALNRRSEFVIISK